MTEPQDLSIEYIPLHELRKMERNPKLHSPDIEESYEKYGYVDPVIIDEGSGKLVAGHGRVERLEIMQEEGKGPPERIKMDSTGAWLVPVIRGVTFESQDQAEEYGVTSNALVIAGGFNEAELEALIEEAGMDPILGMDVEADVAHIMSEVETEVESVGGDALGAESQEINAAREQVALATNDQASESGDSEESGEKKLDDQQIYDQLPFELKGVFELSEEAYFLPEEDDFTNACLGSINRINGAEWIDLPGANPIGIPNLRPDRLVQSLPDDLKIWGDRQSTPDDGESWYFFNYGAVPHRELPFERTIFSFFTHDQHIESWWASPAYRVGQILRKGVKQIVVPDYSLWDISPTAARLHQQDQRG